MVFRAAGEGPGLTWHAPNPFPGFATRPSLHPLVPRLSRPLSFPYPKARQAWQLLCPLLEEARAELRQFDWVTGQKGSLQLSPVSSHLREGVPFEVQNPRPPLKT